MSRRLRASSVALAALLFASVPHAVRGADAAPYDLNVILSLSGPLTFVGKTDQDALNGLQTTINKHGGIHGRPVRFVFHDDKTDPSVARQLFDSIADQHPSVVLGPAGAAACSALSPLVSNGPVLFCLSPSLHPPAGSYVFSAGANSLDCMRAFIRYFRGRGWTRIATLFATDIGGQDADNNLDTLMQLPENKGLTIVAREHFNPSEISVAAQVSRMKAGRPDVVILWEAGAAFATALRGTVDGGMDVPVATSNAVMTYGQMKQYAAFMPKTLLFPGLPYLAGEAPTRQARAAQQDLRDTFTPLGVRPDFIYSTAWDPALLVITALRALPANATASDVRTYLANLHGFTGVAGEYDFRDGSQRGLTQNNVLIVRWDQPKDSWVAVSRLGGAPLP
jgi:branched-chain amino acid transport system substrate-binding protein